MVSSEGMLRPGDMNLSWAQCDAYCATMAGELIATRKHKPDVMLILARGGLTAASLLMRHGVEPKRTDIIWPKSYNEEHKQGLVLLDSVCRRRVELLGLSDDTVLVVDDIFDTGKTLSYVKDGLSRQYGYLVRQRASKITTACMVARHQPTAATWPPVGLDVYGVAANGGWITFPWEADPVNNELGLGPTP